jgi:ABC-type transporter Mla MlaB component
MMYSHTSEMDKIIKRKRQRKSIHCTQLKIVDSTWLAILLSTINLSTGRGKYKKRKEGSTNHEQHVL